MLWQVIVMYIANLFFGAVRVLQLIAFIAAINIKFPLNLQILLTILIQIIHYARYNSYGNFRNVGLGRNWFNLIMLAQNMSLMTGE